MASILLSKLADNLWFHTIIDTDTTPTQIRQINDPNVIALIANSAFSVSLGLASRNREYENFALADVTLQDDSTSGPLEGPFNTFIELSQRLAQLSYIGFRSGINLASGTIPAPAINFELAQVINNVGEFDTNLAGEYIFADETPGTSQVFWFDTAFIDLQAPFRLNEQTIILYALAPGTATIFNDDDDYELFVGSGTVYIINVILSIVGTDSTVFGGLTPSPSRDIIYIENGNFIGCNDLGALDGFDQFIMQDAYAEFCNQGFDFTGLMSVGVIVEGFDSFANDGTMFNADGGLLTEQYYFLKIRNRSNPGSIIWNIDDTNSFTRDVAFQIWRLVNEVSGITIVSGITKGNVASYWTENTGPLVENTTPGVQAIQGVGAVTPIGGNTNWHPITTNFIVLNLDYWVEDAHGRYRYVSETRRDFYLTAKINLQGGNNDRYNIAFNLNGGGVINGGTNLGASPMVTAFGAATNRVDNQFMEYPQTITTNDTIQLYIQKQQAGFGNPTLLENSTFTPRLISIS